MSILTRFGVAVLIALAISLLARRARALSVSGAVAASVIGTLAVVAGWKWAVLLVVYFASASALSRFGAERKEARTRGIIAKGGERDAWQVLANGAVFAAAAASTLVLPARETNWMALAAGVLAASASDTWGTEIGTLYGGIPRSILGFQRVPIGMSGGITLAGTLGAVVGAAFIAVVTLALSWPLPVAVGGFVGGVAGSTIDSVLGATLQKRRWCDRCNRATERDIHDCGAVTVWTGGLAWLDNDAVNLISGLAGGLVALVVTG